MSKTNRPKIVAIIGATATGKTALAIKLAREFKGEIVSADSRQVYRGLDIGTGKDLAEYGQGLAAVPYHLIDVCDPKQQYDLKSYQRSAYAAIDDILKRGKLPIVVGGSGLYLQAVIDGYELSELKPQSNKSHAILSLSELQKKLDPKFLAKLNDSEQKNKRRILRYLEIMNQSDSVHEHMHQQSKPRYQSLVIGLDVSIETIRKNIKKRLDDRFKEGMIEEVAHLQARGLSWERLESFGLEYKYIAQFLQKKLSENLMKEKLYLASGQFAKRQLTWFRRWEKQGREISWLKPQAHKKISKLIAIFSAD